MGGYAGDVVGYDGNDALTGVVNESVKPSVEDGKYKIRKRVNISKFYADSNALNVMLFDTMEHLSPVCKQARISLL